MNASTQHRPVLLLGSVPLSDEEEVFRTASEILGDRLKRIPDGETGVRSNWIGWQAEGFARTPALELLPDSGKNYGVRIRYRIRPDVEPSNVTFYSLGYSDAAIASYKTFARLKSAGVIGAGTRFQVSLPTPLATVTAYTALESRSAVESAYEARLIEELAQICAAIPQDQLAIQWDTAIEFGILEGVMPTHLADPWRDIVARLVRLGEHVPEGIELGYHLCYGDANHQHFVQPKDAGMLVSVANRVCAGVHRRVNWIHLPVPRERDDDAYFAPLTDLRCDPETELYLGLVHYTDGIEGTQRRILAAARINADFGIGTECGMGRRPADTIIRLLQVHKAAADVVVAGEARVGG